MEHERNEYELALRARNGDREALAELVERTRLRLFALAYAELRHYDDAQDAVASALLQICLHVGELREPEKIRAWMQRIVRNEAHRLRRSPDAAMVRLEGEEWPSGSAEPSMLLLDIERALRRLPGSQAEALRLFYFEELSMDDIARCLGRSTGTIGSWLHRGRRHLANAMEEYAPMRPTRPKAAPPAQRVLYRVWWEARQLGDNYIGTEHHLLGLIHEGTSSPAEVLVELGADLERTRREIKAMREEPAPGG